MDEKLSQDLRGQLTALASKQKQDDARTRAQKVHEHVLMDLLGKDWANLEVIERDGHLLFKETLYRRSLSGGFTAEPVLIRVPRDHDLRAARVQAREWALKDRLDLDRDADLVDQLETLCVICRVVHNANTSIDPRTNLPFNEQWIMSPEELEKRYDRAPLLQLWAKIDALGQVVDPRINTLGEEEMLALIAAIAKSRTIAPLHVYGSGAQQAFIVSITSLLLSLLDSKSSLES